MKRAFFHDWHAHGNFHDSISEFSHLIEREAQVKRVAKNIAKKVNTLLASKTEVPDYLNLILEDLRSTKELFPVPDAEDASALNEWLRTKKITLDAIATIPTPVLYTPYFSSVFWGQSGSELRLEDDQIDELEYVALPETVFNIHGVFVDRGNIIYEVTSPEYPYESTDGYYIDARFVNTYWTPVEGLTNREKKLPSQEYILEKLRSAVGLPYVWGWNYASGIPQMKEFYPPKTNIDTQLESKWMLKGVDCSGILYEITDGITPRNTSKLVYFWNPVKVAGKTKEEIIASLRPLDVLVWKWHALIVVDNDQVIESKGSYIDESGNKKNGVRIRGVEEVVTELLTTRIPLDNIDEDVGRSLKFVVRRWYPENA